MGGYGIGFVTANLIMAMIRNQSNQKIYMRVKLWNYTAANTSTAKR